MIMTAKLAFLCLVMIVTGFSQSNEKLITLNEPLGNEKYMKVNIDFGMGEFLLEQGQEKMAVTGYLQYNYKYTDAVFEYRQYGDTGILDIETDFDMDWNGRGKKDDDKSNICEVYLSPNVPVDISADLAFGEGAMNLDGLQLQEFLMDFGLGEMTVDFGKTPNPIQCDRIDIDTGLGGMDVRNLGNSNCPEMEFECGLGGMELDFSGDLKSDLEIDVSVGMGSIDLLIPKGTNLIFEYDGSFLASVDLKDMHETDDGVFYSNDFDDDEYTITVTASVGAGAIEIFWIDE